MVKLKTRKAKMTTFLKICKRLLITKLAKTSSDIDHKTRLRIFWKWN